MCGETNLHLSHETRDKKSRHKKIPRLHVGDGGFWLSYWTLILRQKSKEMPYAAPRTSITPPPFADGLSAIGHRL